MMAGRVPQGSLARAIASQAQFVENAGQCGEAWGRLYSSGPRLAVAFHDDHLRVVVGGSGGVGTPPAATYEVRFMGATPVRPRGVDPTGTGYSFIIGDDPSKWTIGARGYAGVLYAGLWDGVDLLYRLQDGCVKYEFRVRPGADPSAIALAYTGADGVAIDPSGDLVVRTPAGRVLDERPTTFQEGPSGTVEVPSRFTMAADGAVGFEVGPYDPSQALVIDPRLLFSTYVGSASDDWAQDCAVGANGDVYVLGTTAGGAFPATSDALYPASGGGTDVVVCKLGQNGQRLLYATYIGGGGNDNGYYTAPSQAQSFGGIFVDGAGAVYVAGHTNSTDFPTTASAYDRSIGGGYDAFVLKLTPSMDALAYSTLVGGQSDDLATDIAVNADGEAVVVGTTLGYFPTTSGALDTSDNGAEDAFAIKLDSAGSRLLRSTLLGGSGKDWANAVTLDSAGNPFIAGTTEGAGFPVKGAYDSTQNGLRDMFVLKMDAGWAALRYSTFIGTADQDYAADVVADGLGRAYVIGYTTSTAFPVVTGCYDTTSAGGIESIVLRMDASGSALDRCTYFGGTGDDRGVGIDLNPSGEVLITGSTTGSTPASSDAYSKSNAGDSDAFVARLDGTLTTLKYGSLFGGSAEDKPTAIASGKLGDILVVGHSVSANFPTTAGAYLTARPGGCDAFVLKVGEPRPPAWGALPAFDAVEDIQTTVNLSSYVSDPDTPLFRLWLASSSPYFVGTAGLEATFLFPNGVLRPKVAVDLCDEWVKMTGTLNFTVAPVNDPPACTLGGTLFAIEDEPLRIDMTPFVSDVDNATKDLVVTTGSQYATVSGLVVTVVFGEGVVSHELWVNVSDGLASTEAHVDITVSPVDDPPQVASLPVFEAVEDSTSSFNLTPYMSDIDTPVEQLKVSVDNPNITVEGHELQLLRHRPSDLFNVTVTVSDATSRVSVPLQVRVNAVDDPPVVRDLPPQYFIEDTAASIDLMPYLYDEDTPSEGIVVSCTDPCLVSVKGAVLTFLFAAWEPDRMVRFSASDGTSRADGSFMVQVRAVNDAPFVTSIGGRPLPFSVEITEGLDAYFDVAVSDEDSTRFGFTVLSGWSGISVLQNGTVHVLTDIGDVGDYTAVLTVDDLGGRNTTATIHVRVLNVNDPPSEVLLLEPFNHSVVEVGDNVTFAVDVSDPDMNIGQVLIATWSSNITGMLRSLTTKEGLRFVTDGLPVGVHRITVNVTDGQYTSWMWFEVTVQERSVLPPDDEVGEAPFPATALIAGVVIAIVVLVIVAMALIATRGRSGHGEEDEDEAVALGEATGSPMGRGPAPSTGPLRMEGDLAKLGRDIGDMAAKLEAQRAAEAVMAGPSLAPAPAAGAEAEPVKLTQEEEADRERTRDVREVMKLLTQLPQGLPTSLWGWDMAELARAVVDGEKQLTWEGTTLVSVKGRWYNADRSNVGTFMREWKEPEEAPKPAPAPPPLDERQRRIDLLETALLEGKISEQTYRELKAKYER